MTYKTNCNDIVVKTKCILENDVYSILYKFPLLVFKENPKDIDISKIKCLPSWDIESIIVSEYPEDILIKLDDITDKELLLSKYMSYEDTIDNIRRPWVSKRIVELSRETNKDFIEMAEKYSEKYPDSYSFLAILANHYRLIGNNQSSYDYCLKLLERKGLFWEKDEYKKCMNELSIVSYYVNDINKGMMGSDYICLDNKNSANEGIEHLMRNRLFYVKNKPMSYLDSKKYQIEVKKSPGGDDFNIMNPNTIQYNGKTFGVIRTVNYYKYGVRFFI